jgi:hypothetical protein
MMSRDSINIAELLKAARTLEDYLWGKHNEKWGLEEWKRMLRKRLGKIDGIDFTKPHWEVEMRKRLLQLGSVAVACMTAMDEGNIDSAVNPPELMSNLPDYIKINRNLKLAINELKAIQAGSTKSSFCFIPGAIERCIILLEEIYVEQ